MFLHPPSAPLLQELDHKATITRRCFQHGQCGTFSTSAPGAACMFNSALIRGTPVLLVSRTFHGSMGYRGLRPLIWANEEQISTYCLTRGLGECLFLWEKPNWQAPNSRKQQRLFLSLEVILELGMADMVGIWGPQLLALITVPEVHCEPKQLGDCWPLCRKMSNRH